MKLKKGSKEAKEYMASIRAKKKAPKKLGYAPERLKIVKLTTKIAKDKYIKPGYNAKGRAKAYTIAQKEASKILSRVNGVEKHTDTKSHNVRISVVSGEISKGKISLIDNLTYLYGRLSSEYLFATTQREKNRLRKEMMNIKKDIKNLKYYI